MPHEAAQPELPDNMKTKIISHIKTLSPEARAEAAARITAMKKGDLPLIGASAMCEMCIGWTAGDGSGHDGYHVSDFFDLLGRYLGPDEHGIEPIFRDMTEEEVTEYLAQEDLA